MGRKWDPSIASNWDPTTLNSPLGVLTGVATGGVMGPLIGAGIGKAFKKPSMLGMPDAPPPAPDLTDDQVQQAAMAEARRLGMMRGRKSSFLTGGSSAPAAAPAASLLGG